MRELVYRDCNQVKLEQVCSATETSKIQLQIENSNGADEMSMRFVIHFNGCVE